MSIPGTPLVVLGVSRRDVAAYSGNSIQVYKLEDAEYTEIGFDQIGGSPSEDDPTDISALETFANGEAVYVNQIYDRSGNGHHVNINGTTNDSVMQVCDGSGNALVDSNGNLYVDRTSALKWFQSDTAPLTSATAMSCFARISKDADQTPGGMFGPQNGGTGMYFGRYQSESTSTSIQSGVGSPSYYRNDVDITPDTRGDLYTSLNASADIVIFSLVGATISSQTDFAIMRGAFENMLGNLQCWIVYDSDETSNRASIEGYLEGYDAQAPSASIVQPVTITINSSS